jgi:hypothetical protein
MWHLIIFNHLLWANVILSISKNESKGYNNISAILWRSILLVEETGVPAENHRPAEYTSPGRDSYYDHIMLITW